jgi:hypothetical protein
VSCPVFAFHPARSEREVRKLNLCASSGKYSLLASPTGPALPLQSRCAAARIPQ